jgi:hypothetical protein
VSVMQQQKGNGLDTGSLEECGDDSPKTIEELGKSKVRASSCWK